MNALRRWYGPYAHALVWKESAYLLASLGIGIATFTAVVTMLSLSAGMMITLVGLPLLGLTVAGGRLIGAIERARARALLDLITYPPAPMALEGNWWQKGKRLLADGPGWMGLAYGTVMLFWGIVTFTLTVVFWSVAWSFASAPLWAWATDGPPLFHIGDRAYDLNGWEIQGLSFLVCLVGLLLVAVLPRVIHGIANGDRMLVRNLLSRDEREALTARVSELTESRDASVESAASELRRIERDLHDGAQQRLVSVAMNLGMAKERLREVDDPKARELVTQAHDEAKQAIAELRDLVRGIHPAVLTDRGLDAAVSALVARCPVPVELHSELGRRFSAACEATAYFVVAEALTNVAKHSRATSARVRLTERDGVLVVEVSDDGVGGASESTGGGLRGLHDRVKGVEGRLRIASPEGGPTTLIAEVPCGS